MAEYASEVLVEPEWLERHLRDDSIRIVEVDENPALYRLACYRELIFRARSASTGSTNCRPG